MNASFPYTLDPEKIPVKKILKVTDSDGPAPVVRYACPSGCWQQHLKEWQRERRQGNKSAPEPMPAGHLMFDNPISYGCVEYGDNSEASLRQAWEHTVRAMLYGWDRDLEPEQLNQIVQATVNL